MNVQKLHNSHSNLKGCLFLYRLFCNHSSFRWIREETDFSNHSRSIIIPKKIIVGICFNFPVVFYSCKAVHLCLYQTGETFAFGVIWVIEYLGSAGRRIREAFIAPAGSYIVSADYSQIELRIMAHLSEDSSLLKAFHDGQDVHRATASELFDITPLEVNPEQRRYAKVINFGLIYGMSAFGVASNLGISRTDAKNYIDRYFQRYPGVAQYMDNIRTMAREQGYVETVFGRRLWLPEINSPNGPRRQAAERAAINAPMQGTAADIIKLSMIEVENWLENEQLESKLIMQVHDELVLEVPDKELDIVRKKLPELMGSVARLKVPLIAEVGFGKNWDEAH